MLPAVKYSILSWDGAVRSGAELYQAMPGYPIKVISWFNKREHTVTERGEMFQLNPFPRVVFAGLTSTELFYGANQVDDVFYNLSSV